MNRLRTRREYALEISNLSRAGLRPDQLPRQRTDQKPITLIEILVLRLFLKPVRYLDQRLVSLSRRRKRYRRKLDQRVAHEMYDIERGCRRCQIVGHFFLSERRISALTRPGVEHLPFLP
jgi:hypothetical protein